MDERTRDRHSVNCYFCGEEGDEREWQQADKYNGNDGGHICPNCLGKATYGRYLFTIVVSGFGYNADDAWRDACEQFSQEWGVPPDESEWEFEREEELEKFIPEEVQR